MVVVEHFACPLFFSFSLHTAGIERGREATATPWLVTRAAASTSTRRSTSILKGATITDTWYFHKTRQSREPGSRFCVGAQRNASCAATAAYCGGLPYCKQTEASSADTGTTPGIDQRRDCCSKMKVSTKLAPYPGCRGWSTSP